MENKNKKYYVVRDINFARVIKWFTCQDYMVFDDKFNEGQKIYSFENTELLQKTLDEVKELKVKLNER